MGKEAKNLNFLGSHDCSDINHIGNARGWIRITAIMDSGVAENVAPLAFARRYDRNPRRKTYQRFDGEWRCLQRNVSESCRCEAIEFFQQHL